VIIGFIRRTNTVDQFYLESWSKIHFVVLTLNWVALNTTLSQTHLL